MRKRFIKIRSNIRFVCACVCIVWNIIKEMFYYFLNNCLSRCATLPYRDMIKKTDYNVVSLITVLIAVYIIKCTVEINEIIFKMYNLFFLFINQLCDQYSIYSAVRHICMYVCAYSISIWRRFDDFERIERYGKKISKFRTYQLRIMKYVF